MSGIVIGVRDLHFAILESDTKEAVTYQAPKLLANAINISIAPSTSTNTMYASDRAVAIANSMGVVEVELEIDQLDPAVVSELLGIERDDKGVLKYTGDIKAPYVSISFRAPLENGGFRYVQLGKGMFNINEDTYATKGESVEFQTKTISAQFVTREFDNTWKYEADDNDPLVTDQTIFENWFTQVYGSTAA